METEFEDMPHKIVFGIITYNRIDYLKNLIDSYLKTRSNTYEWYLVIADDGSTDGTLDYLEKLLIPDTPIYVIKNSRVHVTRQTNSIFEVAKHLEFDFGFIANDDISFLNSGWDDDYIRASIYNHFDHLVHYNINFRKPRVNISCGDLIAYIDARHCMGCFWTFTPKVLEEVGFLNEEKFIAAGHSHQEFTIRCCRAGFNNAQTLFDAKTANYKIKLFSPVTDKNYKSHKDMKFSNHNRIVLEKSMKTNDIYYFQEEKPKNITLNRVDDYQAPESLTKINKLLYMTF